MLAGPGSRHRHRDDVPESDRGGGRGARHGGGADEAQPATGTSSPSMAPHPFRGRHPGWRLTPLPSRCWARGRSPPRATCSGVRQWTSTIRAHTTLALSPVHPRVPGRIGLSLSYLR